MSAEYKDQRTGEILKASSGEKKGGKFAFPTTGAKILLKTRPPVAKEASTD